MLPQQITTDVLLEKYAKGNETTADDIYKRVAKGIAAVESDEMINVQVSHEDGSAENISMSQKDYWTNVFYQNMQKGAIGAGRIMSAAGTNLQATLLNCYVQGIGDCIEGKDDDGIPGIYEALKESACTLRRGGGVGYNFSKIRPKGAKVKSVESNASGPCSYMDIFDASCSTIESAGLRRGAQLSALNIDHPDILEFVKAKRTPGRWNNFNVSVFVPNSFMEKLDKNEIIDLIHKAEPNEELKEKGAYQRKDGMWVYGFIGAQDLWNIIMQSNYDYAEPGILFDNTINSNNNLRYCERLETTNPCGEQPLPNYGCCDLGPIILSNYVLNPFTDKAQFDYSSFQESVQIQVRFLDNVLDASLWPLEQQRQEAMLKRRIGVGFTGLGNALAMLNLGYNTPEGILEASKIAEVMRNAAYFASCGLAKEKGSFPLLDTELYLSSGTCASRLPEDIKELIRQHGIRNSHLLSIAPTGTTSLAFADNASNGIEPPFSLAYNRKKRNGDGTTQTYAVVDHGLRVFLSLMEDQLFAEVLLEAICNYRDKFIYNNQEYRVKECIPKTMITALELSVDDHLAMMQAVQPFICTSISKTVNIPADMSFEDFKEVYSKAYVMGLKGVATYRPNNILGSVLSVGIEEKKEEKKLEVSTAPIVDVYNTFIKKRPDGTLDSKTKKVVYTSNFVEDKFYVGVSFTKETKRPIEVFFTVCPDGVPQEWLDAYAINMSLLARGGLDLFCKALRANRNVKSDKGQVRYGWYTKADGNRVPKFHSSEVACMAFAIQEILMEEGIIDANGFPIDIKSEIIVNTTNTKPVVTLPVVAEGVTVSVEIDTSNDIIPGKLCKECGAFAVIKVEGCERCTNCGVQGGCGN